MTVAEAEKTKEQASHSRKIIWQPQPGAQEWFCELDIFEVFYGGAAGGGKSDALLGDALYQVGNPHYRAIIFRRDTGQLRRLIDRSQEIYPKCYPGAEWKDQKHVWVFPSGAKVSLWHMEHEKNKFQHDGQEYQFIGFDELTHFSSTQYKYLLSRCRTSDPKLQCFIRATGMPMGPGINWVRQRFIDNGPYNIVTDPQTGLERVWIPAQLEDNPALFKTDPTYDARLKLMGPRLYHALRHGDWTVIEGAYFSELTKHDHEVAPHPIPPGAIVFRALDWGYAKPFSIGWYYADYDDNIVRFAEWYGCKQGEVDVGMRLGAAEVARGIKRIEQELKIDKDVQYGVADPSIWSKQDEGPSIADAMAGEGVGWNPAINDRVQGWMELHANLYCEGEAKPRFKVTSNCKAFWRTVPILTHDERKPEDLDSKLEDHVADEVRYALMSRPRGSGQGIILGEDTATAGMDW